MTLQRFLIPQPAVGHDWAWVVPGQYDATILSVTAQLAATANPTTANDSSGNGNNATYGPATGVTYGVTGPFGAGGGLAVQMPDVGNQDRLATFPNSGGALDNAAFTVEAIVWYDTNSDGHAIEYVLVDRIPFGANGWGAGFKPGVATAQPAGFDGSGTVFTIGSAFSSAAWHHLAITQTGGTWTPYVDGVVGASAAGHAIGAGPLLHAVAIAGDESGTGECIHGKVAAVAYYPAVLAGANIVNHFNAIATSAAAYKTAVLTDSPSALWMLDEVQSHFQRTAILEVSDGTNTLQAFPGFAPSQQSSLFTWSWVANAANAAQSPAQDVTVVPITPVTLPPGYILETVTPDLTTLDQWKNIVVWADIADSGGGGTGGTGANALYSDALLVPDYPNGAP